MFVVCQYKKKFVVGQTASSGMGMREKGGGGVELDHERRVRKRTGWKVHIESNPRNTSVLGSECVLVDANRQDEVKSAHLCLRFNVDPPASSFSSLSLVTPYPPPPPSLSLSFLFLTKPFGERRTLYCILWHLFVKFPFSAIKTS